MSLVATLFLALAPFQSPSPRVEDGGPEWHFDLDRAFALAERSDRPLMIVFR